MDIPTLAQGFAGRIVAAQAALAGTRLNRYADEITVMLPRTGPEFERFVTYCEALVGCLRNVGPEAHGAVLAVSTLAQDARHILALYQAQG